MSGFDRYYQIVKCFRDEDLRADRQPEFTQIDIETSFMSADQVMAVTEQMVRGLFQQMLAVDLGEFPRMTGMKRCVALVATSLICVTRWSWLMLLMCCKKLNLKFSLAQLMILKGA